MNSNANLNFASTPIYPYQELTFENSLPNLYQLRLAKRKQGGCCCTCGKGIKGNIIFLIVMSILTVGFCFCAKLTSLSTMDEYKVLKQKIITLNEEENKLLYSYY